MKKHLLAIFCLMFGCLISSLVVGGDYAKIKGAADLGKYIGQNVLVEGKVSKVIWQHVISSPKTHPYFVYFDVGEGQTIVYTKEKINCESEATVKGKVVEVKVSPKKPGKTKISEEDYSKYHIMAESVECKGL